MGYFFRKSNRRRQTGDAIDTSENSGTSTTVQGGESNSFKNGSIKGKSDGGHDRRGSKISNSSNNSSKSLSCSARTMKCRPGRALGRDRGQRGKIVTGYSSRSNSSKSFISDLDIESGEMLSADMDVIGESSQEETEDEIADALKMARISRPQHFRLSDDSSSCDFNLASNRNLNSNNNRSRKYDNDNLSADNATHSNNSGDMNESGCFDETKSVMMDKRRAAKVGRPGTKFVYAVLFCTAAILSVATYFFVKNSEYNEFKSEFRSYARETADLAETSAAHTFSQLNTLATTITSAGLLESYQHDYQNEPMGKSRRIRERERLLEEGKFHSGKHSPFYYTGSWPNVTIPHFDERIQDLSESAGATMLLYIPLVQLKDRDGFESFANYHSPWKRRAEYKNKQNNDLVQADSLTITKNINNEYEGGENATIGQDPYDEITINKSSAMESAIHSQHQDHSSNSSVTNNGDPSYMRIRPCLHFHPTDISNMTGYENLDNFAEGVLEHYGGISDPAGLSAPIYQYGGPNHVKDTDSEIALMDLWTHPVFRKEVIASIEYDVPVITEYLDVSFLQDALSTSDSSTNEASEGNLAPLSSLQSLTIDRVKASFEHDAGTIGYVVGVVPWSTFFQNVLDRRKKTQGTSPPDGLSTEKDVNGIVVKVVSDCGSIFTFVLNSGNQEIQTYLGDWREQYWKYEDLEYESTFFYKDHAKGVSRHCHFDLHIYPNNEFQGAYQTAAPWLYALAVVTIFVFTAIIFACYDAFIFKGQEHIVSEAAGMVVENARRAARNERDLNDFIAHEVRNPLAAAISACAFVSSAVMDDQTLHGSSEGSDFERLALIPSNEKRMEVQEDIKIIDSSLHFINDLLRNMLDMQRAGSNQIDIENKPTDIMNDIFKPVEAMMHLRDAPFKVILECSSSGSCMTNNFDDDDHLIVMTDPLRLKQVVLNLTRNASKFVEKGFIRCCAKVNPVDGFVLLYVDDSGPGIPEEKRKRVFGKFQQSLDIVQQGTGIGLSLCKKMIDLMGGSLYIDDKYESGIQGCPGTRFVIQLRIPPLQLNHTILDDQIARHDRARCRRHEAAGLHLITRKTSLSPSCLIDPNDSVGTVTNDSTFKTSASSVTTDKTQINDNSGSPSKASKATNDAKTLEKNVDCAKERKEDEQAWVALPLKTSLQLNLNTPNPDDNNVADEEKQKGHQLAELPENLSVLFVDDDMILRKLFSRTLKKINPSWTVQEASSGEIAIELITSKMGKHKDGGDTRQGGFDLIFMDQYMASVQKQLLGTESVRAIRSKGFHKPIICGLSANDVEDAFYDAGSDAFMFKPFPCKKDELETELLRVLNTRRQ